jgi:CHAT domain-containing protein
MSLENTDLVVLSACETGLGEVKNGEGVYGLQRSFQIAGAKAIINSLWTVNDETTMLLMTSFYREWMKTNDKRKAFRSAQAMVRAKFPHPYYWGAFVMIGD